VTGTIEMGSGSFITFDVGATLNLGSIVFSVLAGNFGKIDMQSGSELTVDSGALIDVLNGGLVVVEPGGSIHANGAGGVLAQAVGSVKSTVNGGIQFGGSATDFGSFVAPRPKTVTFPVVPLDPTLAGGNWSYSNASATLAGKGVPNVIPLRLDLHNGANLVSVTVTFFVADPHAGGVPFVLPGLTLNRVLINPGGVPSAAQTLSATDPQIFGTLPEPHTNPASGAAWYASGNQQQITYVTDRNFTIDNVNYAYYLYLIDEHGAGAHFGNVYLQVTATFANITDLRFPN
jgi:hypothetical protein